MEQFLVRDWTDAKDDVEPTHKLVFGAKAVVEAIANAKDRGRKITVYTVGECLLDWS